MTTFVFAGGGSGGHLFPGIAVAEELKRVDPACECVFVGSDRPIESRILEPLRYRHSSLSVPSTASLLKSPFASAKSLWRSYRSAAALIEELEPRVVVGLGGGFSVPTVLAASRRCIPIVLLEQNAVLGRANRALLPIANRLCLSFAQSSIPSRYASITVVTGNPLRRSIVNAAANRSSSKSNFLLILGGSQGARSLNEVVLGALSHVKPLLHGWRLIHQSGSQDVSCVKTAYADMGISATVVPFLDDIGSIYSQTTLAITRAGGTTLAELAMHSIPAIVVPYPRSIRDHQTLNAREYDRVGGARLVPEIGSTDPTASHLREVLRPLLSDRNVRLIAGESMFSMAFPIAAQSVAKIILEYCSSIPTSSTDRLSQEGLARAS